MKEQRRRRSRKCKHCGEIYFPDPRTLSRQRYCGKADCRKASKAASQRRWAGKACNADYFRCPENVKRVQRWRVDNPDYWKRRPRRPVALQDQCSSQSAVVQDHKEELGNVALQDDWFMQSPVIIGLASQLSEYTLQDDIALFLRQMHAVGRCILGMEHGMPGKGGGNDRQAYIVPAAAAAGTRAVQLGGPSPGA